MQWISVDRVSKDACLDLKLNNKDIRANSMKRIASRPLFEGLLQILLDANSANSLMYMYQGLPSELSECLLGSSSPGYFSIAVQGPP